MQWPIHAVLWQAATASGLSLYSPLTLKPHNNFMSWTTARVRLLCCLLAAIIPGAVTMAAEAPRPSAEAIALDDNIQVLKDEAIELNVTLQGLEDRFAYPAPTALSVYVGSAEIGAFLNEVAVTLDGHEVARYSYSEQESRALLKRGLHRVLRINVEPGTHRLQATFTGKTFGDKGGQAITETASGTLQKGEREAAVELRFGNGGKVLPIGGYKRGSAEDPQVRTADFLNSDTRHFSAASMLLALKAGSDQKQRLPADFSWRLAESYLAFGMRNRAEQLYRDLALTTTDHLALGRARLKLSEFLYARGYLEEATASLMRMREKLPDPLALQWQDLLARTLMAQDHWEDAIEVLTEMKNGDKQSPYTRYDLAVALINNNRGSEGETILDKLGRITPKTTEEAALRDKANLALGYYFLRKAQGGTAKPIFGRVRVEGPYSNRALLGMGWAELAPQGNKQKKADVGDSIEPDNPLKSLATLGILLNPARVVDDPFKRVGLRDFKLSNTSSEEVINLRRALVPWAELVNRDQMDPAVQEGMLAVPFSLDRIGAHIEAQQFYEKAVGLLEETRQRLDRASQYIRENRMVETIVRRDIDAESGFDWRLRDLPDAPETFYLQSVIAENRYQEALKNYRDLRFLNRNLDGFKARLDQLDKIAAEQPVGAADAAALIARAKALRPAERAKLKLRLHMDVQITAPYSTPMPAMPLPALNLKLAETPPRFNGVREVSADVRQALDLLRPKVSEASAQQLQVLQTIALDELAAQKKQVEQYLVEARFALARIYEDRIGSAPAAKLDAAKATRKKKWWQP